MEKGKRTQTYSWGQASLTSDFGEVMATFRKESNLDSPTHTFPPFLSLHSSEVVLMYTPMCMAIQQPKKMYKTTYAPTSWPVVSRFSLSK